MIPVVEPARDTRNAADITEELLRRHPGYVPEWLPAPFTTGNGLANIVARYLYSIAQRLNQAPDKNRLAFFDLLGFGLVPARSARAPIVFQLTDGAPDATAPAGTEVSAPPPPGSSDQIVFETEAAVAVAAAKLAQLVSLWPGRDQYLDHSATLAAAQQPVTLFDHLLLQPTPHIVYLAHDVLFNLTGTTRLDVEMEVVHPGSTSLDIRWEYWDGQVWRGFKGQQAACAGILEERLDTTLGLTRSGTFRLETDCAQAAPTAVNGITSNWIRGRLADPLPPDPARALPELASIRVSSIISKVLESTAPPAGGILPDLAFSNGTKLDLTKAFYPFNQTPQAGTVFYFSSNEALGRSGATVTLAFTRVTTPTDTLGTSNVSHAVAWEYWNGTDWVDLGVSGDMSTDPNDLSRSGVIVFTVPPDLEKTKVNDEDGYWVRVRIVSGGYGFTNTVTLPAGSNPATISFVVPQPPVLGAFRIGYAWQNAFVHPQHTLAFNDFTYEDRTFEAQWPGNSFQIFHPVSDLTPAVYLGFDKPLPVDSIGLYFALIEQAGDDHGPALVWEYWNGSWVAFTVQDETANLRMPGIVSFIGQEDSLPLERFYSTRTWIRARLKEDGPPGEPMLTAIQPNAVWASQQRTITNQALGASNGLPSQVFIVTQIPMLEGERVEVQEISGARANVEWRILATEIAGPGSGIIPALEAQLAAEGPQTDLQYGDIRLVRDRTKTVTEVWAHWTSLPNFYTAAADTRCYVPDRALGRLQFGDGVHGTIPPPGAAILARSFQSGGGAIGNLPLGAIKQILGSVPGVQGASNVAAAEGGSDGETLDAYSKRVPLTMRARGRAVTPGDYEALAREASSAVAVAHALPTRSDTGRPLAGWVTVRILPRSTDAKPVPSFDLREEVARYLNDRAPADIAARQHIYVTGPNYLDIDVEATLAPREADQAGEVEQAATAALQKFLHPLFGGPEGHGWRPGRDVYLSDVAAALGKVTGLDYIEDLALFKDGVRQAERVAIGPDRTVAAGTLRLKMKAA